MEHFVCGDVSFTSRLHVMFFGAVVGFVICLCWVTCGCVFMRSFKVYLWLLFLVNCGAFSFVNFVYCVERLYADSFALATWVIISFWYHIKLCLWLHTSLLVNLDMGILVAYFSLLHVNLGCDVFKFGHWALQYGTLDTYRPKLQFAIKHATSISFYFVVLGFRLSDMVFCSALLSFLGVRNLRFVCLNFLDAVWYSGTFVWQSAEPVTGCWLMCSMFARFDFVLIPNANASACSYTLGFVHVYSGRVWNRFAAAAGYDSCTCFACLPLNHVVQALFFSFCVDVWFGVLLCAFMYLLIGVWVCYLCCFSLRQLGCGCVLFYYKYLVDNFMVFMVNFYVTCENCGLIGMMCLRYGELVWLLRILSMLGFRCVVWFVNLFHLLLYGICRILHFCIFALELIILRLYLDLGYSVMRASWNSNFMFMNFRVIAFCNVSLWLFEFAYVVFGFRCAGFAAVYCVINNGCRFGPDMVLVTGRLFDYILQVGFGN
eukprot:gene2801-1786_t